MKSEMAKRGLNAYLKFGVEGLSVCGSEQVWRRNQSKGRVWTPDQRAELEKGLAYGWELGSVYGSFNFIYS